MGLVTLSSLLISVACLGWLGYAKGVHEDIYNGVTARQGQFPYMVGLRAYFPDAEGFCGGSLIAPTWVVTAAHCVWNNVSVPSVKVILGTIDVNNNTGSVQINSSAVYSHPQYTPANMNNDIALIRLSQPAPRNNPNIGFIALPKKSQSKPNSFDNYGVFTIGWGAIDDEHVPKSLQYTLQSIIKHDKCRAYMTKNHLTLTDGMLCANRDTILGVTGACGGDSGGPIVTMSWWPVLVGMPSWMFGPCNGTTPDIVVNVGHYVTWINNVTGIPLR